MTEPNSGFLTHGVSGASGCYRKMKRTSGTGSENLVREPIDPQLTPAWLREKLAEAACSSRNVCWISIPLPVLEISTGMRFCFRQKICPARPTCSLKDPEWQTLAAVIPVVLQKAVEDRRMTPGEYLDGRGKEYRNDPFLQVYGHEGDACPCCGAALKRIVLSRRSSVYCANCQPEQPMP